jgi:hypothetical protein
MVQAEQLTLNVKKTSIVRFTPTKFSHHPLNLVHADQALTDLRYPKISRLAS